MACLLTQGFTIDCRNDGAGIDSIFVIEWNSSDTFTSASGEITAATLATSRAFFKYELVEQTGSLEIVGTVDNGNGTVMHESDLTIKLNGYSTAKRNEMKLLAKTRLRIIVKDTEGNYILLGKNKGVNVVNYKHAFGTAFSDHKGQEIVFKHLENDDPFLLQASVVTSLNLS